MTYASINFKTKKAFREAVERGEVVTLYEPGLGRAPSRAGPASRVRGIPSLTAGMPRSRWPEAGLRKSAEGRGASGSQSPGCPMRSTTTTTTTPPRLKLILGHSYGIIVSHNSSLVLLFLS